VSVQVLWDPRTKPSPRKKEISAHKVCTLGGEPERAPRRACATASGCNGLPAASASGGLAGSSACQP
jgi:hypothetical protein